MPKKRYTALAEMSMAYEVEFDEDEIPAGMDSGSMPTILPNKVLTQSSLTAVTSRYMMLCMMEMTNDASNTY